MDDERLIKLVKRYKFLYGSLGYVSCEKYEKKEQAWQIIAKELGVTKDDCKRRWSHLRQRYTKENRRRKVLERNGLKTSNPWPLLYDLQFLEEHIIPRYGRRVGSLPGEELSSTQVSISVEKEDFNTTESVTQESERESSPSASVSDQEFDDDFMQPDSVSSFVTQPKFESIRQASKLDVQPTSSRQINDELSLNEPEVDRNAKNIATEVLKQIRATTQSRHRNPAVDGFGQMIVETICSMSERKQAVAMQKITEIAMKLKMEPDY